jgi:lipopolysaccharide/colanic/teichoic acid biosynthesis glycosyltransferase/NDP-sugar pyrophosphorylase family protein
MEARLKVKKAVIVEDGQAVQLAPLTNGSPAFMSPLFHKPLIRYTIDFLKKNGFEDILIVLPEAKRVPDDLKRAKIPGVSIEYYQEDRPRGTAGILKDLETFLGQAPFLVINSNLFLGDMDLASFIEFHLETDPVVTCGVDRDLNGRGFDKRFKTHADKTREGSALFHSFADMEGLWTFSDIYLFNPSVLRFIGQESYMDIKEQLIPALLKESLDVSPYQIEGFHLLLKNLNDYMTLHRTLLSKNDSQDFVDKERIAEGIWVGKNVRLSPQAYLLGPIMIGDGSEIKESAQIIGPTVIGNGCQISEGALVRESILRDDVSLAAHARVEYSIIGGGSDVPSNSFIKNTIVLNDLNIETANLISAGYSIKDVLDLSGIVSFIGLRQKIYHTVKRIMDLTLSSIGIVLLLPLFFFLAILIKIESRGPLFYLQKRCGKGGKLFTMIKLRTMVANAEQFQQEFTPLKETDGPMFKLFDDPRITRIGKMLRKTSLDELPQLLNVLRGDMSLVGPRPLIMDEMKFSPSWREIRLSVKPGITGLWQIRGRRDAWFHDWIRYDLSYVRNQSLWQDIKILYGTIRVVLKREGAY